MSASNDVNGDGCDKSAPGEGYAESFVRPGWSARFRGVEITRMPGEEGTFIVEPLPPSDGDEQWRPHVFETSRRQVRIIAPDTVRITGWTGRIAEIERRPERPGDLGWELIPPPLTSAILG